MIVQPTGSSAPPRKPNPAGSVMPPAHGRVRAALAASEQERRARVAAAWELLADLFGYRIRPETGATAIVLTDPGEVLKVPEQDAPFPARAAADTLPVDRLP
jgi:hypothetical protein